MTDVNQSDYIGPSGALKDSPSYTIVSGDLEAMFLPGFGMIGTSLRHQGTEILRCIEDLDALAAKGSVAGIPLLHPWANRLAAHHYRVAGQEVRLDPSSPLLHHDDHGLPIHGVPWPHLEWQLIEARHDSLVARFEWDQSDLLTLFPFHHRIEMIVTLRPGGLTVETTLTAGENTLVPVSFGFHPYFGINTLPRSKWRLRLPEMQMLELNRYGIPTGKQESFGGFDAELGDLEFDQGFALPEETLSFSLAGTDRRITVDFLKGYHYAQVFAPRSQACVALEPMTAPTNALMTGSGLRLVKPGECFQAAFRIGVDTFP